MKFRLESARNTPHCVSIWPNSTKFTLHCYFFDKSKINNFWSSRISRDHQKRVKMLLAPKITASGILNLGYVYSNNFVPSAIYNQTIRWWKRKPMWLPIAKTKKFRIPRVPVIPDEDKFELKYLHNNYRTLARSVSYVE